MADDKKTYLINFESNLKDYIALLVEAEKVKKANSDADKALKDSGTATAEQIALSEAKVRNANKEYSNAKKNVDLVTQANTANSGSYDQLLKQWQLAQTQLKLMSNGFTTNAEGVKVLSEKYVEQSKVVANAKKSLDAFGKGVNDNRLNVGSYSEALQEMMDKFTDLPGPIGEAASGVQGFLGMFSSSGPLIMGVTAGLALISAPFIAFFKYTEDGMEMLERKTAGFNAQLDVLKGKLAGVGKDNQGLLSSSEFEDNLRNAIKVKIFGLELATQMESARIAAEKNTEALQDLEDAERAMLVPRSKANMQLKESRLLYADETKSIQTRIDALANALKIEGETADKEIGLAQYKVLTLRNINAEKKKAGILTDADDLKLQQAMAREIDLQTESIGRQLRVVKTLAAARKEIEGEQREKVKPLEKAATDNIASLNEILSIEKIKLDGLKDQRIISEMDTAQRIYDYRLAAGENLYAAERDLMAAQMASQLETVRKGSADEFLIKEKYSEYAKALAEEEKNAKLSIYGDFAGSLAGLFGENTKVGKIAAVAQATINTYLGATAAFAQTPGGIVIKSIADAAAVVSGIASVRKILAVKSGLPGDSGGSAPTAIADSPPAQRVFAQSAGSSILTQPQLTQPQLNALPNGGMLTAADIALEFAKLPSPQVKVLDITEGIKSSEKISVRANI
jgi:hypothetical protein